MSPFVDYSPLGLVVHHWISSYPVDEIWRKTSLIQNEGKSINIIGLPNGIHWLRWVVTYPGFDSATK